METRIAEIAERIKTLREILELSVEHMAKATGVSVDEYVALESGNTDFSFTFLYRCSDVFHVDLVELLTGENPRLSFYSVIRKDKGLPIKRREGFTYQHLAPLFKGKYAEPFLVTAPFHQQEQEQPIHLSSHEGQEFDFVLEGSLKVAMENHIEILHEGDAIYYNSGHGHGMIAIDGSDCTFLAVVLKDHKEAEEKHNG
ncbi:helix-turn-helix domain-containing protein [Acetanaerobacterium elongatum]|uniref:Transcriptional regulator, XRE family with cupin sensor n=1 Tax=Acetanaerobacterium elongatum TaxID=258515 RepID=A0A1G9WWF6_9FIRM|nr:XRE family transcriptional regulator [Acetanaerobacterium elongatum]SDM88832.1 transcriptional regulator, XRE family with cupin sensor [Acetanaerobacterium elongatum]